MSSNFLLRKKWQTPQTFSSTALLVEKLKVLGIQTSPSHLYAFFVLGEIMYTTVQLLISPKVIASLQLQLNDDLQQLSADFQATHEQLTYQALAATALQIYAPELSPIYAVSISDSAALTAIEYNGKPLHTFLTEPAKIAPQAIDTQLSYIKSAWTFLPEDLLEKVNLALDLYKEEHQLRIPGGHAKPEVYYPQSNDEIESFTADQSWMPDVVLLAKQTYVWLDQLSQKYKLEISTLDQIPDEELDEIQSSGITALWLIGIWERSYASRRIKQLRGNPTAVGSAYAINRYEIDRELGGYVAYKNLRDRLLHRGVRLGADMVPNHMAIDSQWVIEHPDWFIFATEPPYPSYTYSGENLCRTPDVSLKIEDKYFSEADAAVTYEFIKNGTPYYIYHGNDGTAIPWNDTAQLNYLKSEVREAVIQAILKVAKMFPIIRFDAAMVLVKRHIRRLWFPKRGEGGAIASRAHYAISDKEFNKLLPTEFWRDVVDRINTDLPDTLLIAEAFWMLEGYFVRTLGMHRVYNSAFMHMLRDEENKKYRQSIKNILNTNRQILKRFVNFLTTPDEEPAIKQYGDHDKYFGITVLMCTLPGLPMFGHGQFEGFREKYGMEFKKPTLQEQVNRGVLFRHKLHIVPLLHKRYLFSEVDNFMLFDFHATNINHNVYAFTNRKHGELALVFFNNSYNSTQGYIHYAFACKNTTKIAFLDLLPLNSELYVICKDIINNLEYIRSVAELRQDGFYIELPGYKYHVFSEFRLVGVEYEQAYAKFGYCGTQNMHEFLTRE